MTSHTKSTIIRYINLFDDDVEQFKNQSAILLAHRTKKQAKAYVEQEKLTTHSQHLGVCKVVIQLPNTRGRYGG